MCAKQIDRRDQHQPAKNGTRKHIRSNLKATNVTYTDQCRINLCTDLSVNLIDRQCCDIRNNLETVHDKLNQSRNTHSNKHDCCISAAFLSGKQNLCTRCSLRIRKGSMLFYDQCLAQWHHETNAQQTADHCN